MTISSDGSSYLLVTAHGSIDGIDCITADDAHEEPLHVADDSSDLPNNPEQGPSVSVDKATIPTRTNKRPLHFAETRFEVVTLHELGTVPVLFLPTHCFYCLHEHIRERAPPELG